VCVCVCVWVCLFVRARERERKRERERAREVDLIQHIGSLFLLHCAFDVGGETEEGWRISIRHVEDELLVVLVRCAGGHLQVG
jgi:hypothetical protein